MKFTPRGYQKEILERTVQNTNLGYNTLIELDCGSGKRYLQYEFITNIFGKYRILLLLQATTSLYETFRYFKDIYKIKDVAMIDSRNASAARASILKNNRITLALPQTLMNTLKQYPDSLNGYQIVLINEVDQILRRRSTGSNSLKQPYPKLLPILKQCLIVGMSGTLRDDHYIEDSKQMMIKQDLQALMDYFGNTSLIPMSDLMHTDIEEYISKTTIIPTPVEDNSMVGLTTELEAHIDENRDKVIEEVVTYDEKLADELRKKPHLIFSTYLEIDERILQKFHRGYLVRKYLWGQPGENSKTHLYQYGLDQQWVRDTIKTIPGKFWKTLDLVKNSPKTVVLCSFISTCDLLESLCQSEGIGTVKITGKVPQMNRDELLQNFKSSDKQMVAIISNVGERDIDIPEANLLIVFDLVRTVKTVYQKLKRTRGGECRLLYYDGTDEYKKVSSVVEGILEKYPWSVVVESFSDGKQK